MTEQTVAAEVVLSDDEVQGILAALAWDWGDDPGIPTPREAASEVFAYVAHLLAAREAKARAEAWDRGYRRGGSDRITSEVTPNPYRAAARGVEGAS